MCAAWTRARSASIHLHPCPLAGDLAKCYWGQDAGVQKEGRIWSVEATSQENKMEPEIKGNMEIPQ